MKTISYLLITLALIPSQFLLAHCEIPCGIYDDEMRFEMISEHIATIEKSIKQIIELSQEKDKDDHQLIRWVHNKEEHASKIQWIVSQYFLTQRIIPTDPSAKEEYHHYQKRLEYLHKLLFLSMKTKQTTDLSYVEQLRQVLSLFRKSYFS